MRSRKGQSILLLVAVLAASLLGHGHAQGQEAQLPADPLASVCASLNADREAADKAVADGDVWKAATTLAYSLRKIPDDDPKFINDALVEAGVVATRFAVYIMGDLMDDSMRQQFLEKALNPGKHATDELLKLQYDVTHGPTVEETHQIIDKFWELANGSNATVRVGSLAILAAPYSFELWPHRAQARTILVQDYPDLEITREILQASLVACKNKGPEIAEAMATVVNTELATPEEQRVLQSDRASSIAIAALPQLGGAKSKGEGVAALCRGITDEPDWRTRLACINQAVGFRDIGHAAEVETACETLAKSVQDTPDVIRAKCLLHGYARDKGDIEKVRLRGEQLLGIGHVVDTIDRTMHEDVANSIQFHADFLEKNGQAEEAATVLDRLAAKFPNSALAAKCQERAAKLRKK